MICARYYNSWRRGCKGGWVKGWWKGMCKYIYDSIYHFFWNEIRHGPSTWLMRWVMMQNYYHEFWISEWFAADWNCTCTWNIKILRRDRAMLIEPSTALDVQTLISLWIFSNPMSSKLMTNSDRRQQVIDSHRYTVRTGKGAQSRVTHPVEQRTFGHWSQVTSPFAQFVPLSHTA